MGEMEQADSPRCSVFLFPNKRMTQVAEKEKVGKGEETKMKVKSHTAQYVFIGVAVTLTVIAVVASGVIEIELSTDAIDLAVIAKSEDVIAGVAKLVYSRQKRITGASLQVARIASTIGTPITNPAQTVAELNESLYPRITPIAGDDDSVSGFSMRILFPTDGGRGNFSAPPRQNKTEQMQCEHICARSGDPVYTAAATITLFRDVMRNGSLHWWGCSDDTGELVHGLVLSEVPKDIPILPTLGREIWTYNSLLHFANGSFEDGFWGKPLIQIAQDSNVFYYFSYTRQYYMPVHRAVSVVIIYELAEHLLDVTLKLKEDDMLMITDESGRVLSFTGSPNGDASQRNCSPMTGVPFFTGQCADIEPYQQANPLVRSMLMGYGERIRASGSTPSTLFARVNDESYIVTSQRIFSGDRLFLTATYVSKRDALYGSFRRDALLITVLCAVFVFLAAIALGLLCFLLLRRSAQTISLTFEVSQCLAVLDTNGAAECLTQQQSGSADQDIRELLLAVTAHLKLYKPFLSQAVTARSQEEESDSSSERTSQAHDPQVFAIMPDLEEQSLNPGPSNLNKVLSGLSSTRLSETCFRTRRGTVVLCKLLGCSCSDMSAVTRLHECFHACVVQEGGIVDQMWPTSIIATFNYHQTVVMHQAAAGRAAQKAVTQLKADHLHAVVAIVSSTNYVATFGSAARKARVVAGYGVDLAQKLARLSEVLGISILMNEQASVTFPTPTLLVDLIEPRVEDHRVSQKTVSVFAPLSMLHMDENAASVFTKAMLQLKESNACDAVATLRSYLSGARNATPSSHLFRLLEICEKQIKLKAVYPRKEQWWECYEVGWEKAQQQSPLTSDEGTNAAPAAGSKTTTEAEFAAKLIEGGVPAMSQHDEGLVSMFLQDDAPAEEVNVMPLDGMLLPNRCPFDAICDNRGEEWAISHDPPLGRGSFASVYLASSTTTGAMAALKLFDLMRAETDAAALIREVEVLSSLQNPNIASYVSCCITRTHSHFGIFMEYLGAGSLRNYLSHFGPVPSTAARCYFVDILTGLCFLHDHNEVHNDIKPDNVLLTTEGTCKLADFGTTRLVGMTSTTCPTFGTPRYTAPEALHGHASVKSDVWSVGVLFVEMICGTNPFSHIRGNDAQFLAAVSARPEEFVPRYSLPVSTDPTLAHIIEACLQRDPQQRPAAADILQQLQ